MSQNGEPDRQAGASADGLRVSEVLGALSHALDLTEGQPPGHCLRACWIGLCIGQQLDLSFDELWELYYTIVLKDVGCSSNAARICQLYLADDRSIKRDYKQVDGSMPQLLGFVLTHAGLQAPLAERFRLLLNIFQNGGKISRELIETRCQRGADIARKLRFSDAVAAGIKSLDEHWDGRGQPGGVAGAAIPLPSRIALLAQVADVFFISAGEDAARQEVRRRCGTWFDPRVVAAFERAAAEPAFWASLASTDIDAMIYAMEPARQRREADAQYLDDIAEGFADVVDSKSPFTSGHSRRVAHYSDLVARTMGLGVARRRWLHRAALLHDIGKLGVSNSVLDKPGKLDADEWAAIRLHPVHSRTILSRIEAFAGVARIGGDHHEKLDGSGYPRRLARAAIDLETRIVTVADVFDALTADRPYRGAMTVAQALGIMAEDAGSAFDQDCLDALHANFPACSGQRLAS